MPEEWYPQLTSGLHMHTHLHTYVHLYKHEYHTTPPLQITTQINSKHVLYFLSEMDVGRVQVFEVRN